MGESADAYLPSELLEEPSIKPTFVDLTETYLGGGGDAKLASVTVFFDENSDSQRGCFRGVVLEFEGGEGLAFDPFDFSGIRMAIVPDLSVVMSNQAGVQAVRIQPQPDMDPGGSSNFDQS